MAPQFQLPPWTGYNFVPTIHSQTPDFILPQNQTLPTLFVVCIAGASRDIGAKTAEAFAKAGASGLVLTATKLANLTKVTETCKAVARNTDIKISNVKLDAGSEEDSVHLAEVISQEQGRLDVLINNFGLVTTDPSGFGPLDKVTLQQVEGTMRVNYTGKLLLAKHLLPVLLKSSNGARTIVNVSAMAAHFASLGAFTMSISQLASLRLMEGIAEMYAGESVLAYAVDPGAVCCIEYRQCSLKQLQVALTVPLQPKVGDKTEYPPGMPEQMIAMLHDDAELCGSFLIWLVKERREWLNGRYVSAKWDVDELQKKRDDIVEKDMLKMRMVV